MYPKTVIALILLAWLLVLVTLLAVLYEFTPVFNGGSEESEYDDVNDPSPFPTIFPSNSPVETTQEPSPAPTKFPTIPPTASPTTIPPTASPTTSAPTRFPTTVLPTVSPTKFPTTASPIPLPTSIPTVGPTHFPTLFPTSNPPPTRSPTTSSPTFPVTAGPTCPVNVGEVVRRGNDYVSLVFTACPSATALTAFQEAAYRWSDIIAQNSISPLGSGTNFDAAAFCGVGGTAIFNGFTFNHLVIMVEVIEIDGVNGVLGRAGPCALDANNKFPLLGAMKFDNADINAMQTSGILKFVVLHEMGHVLGLGTLWKLMKQGGGIAGPVLERLVQTPIFNDDGTANANNIPKFVGTGARAEYSALKGSARAFVPAEDGRNALGVQQFDIANGAGRGSLDSHWKITEFDNELMVFAIDPNDARHPLSRMSIQSLADLGYSVNVNLADSYSLPLAMENGKKKNLRLDEMIYLGDDILPSFKEHGLKKLPTAK